MAPTHADSAAIVEETVVYGSRSVDDTGAFTQLARKEIEAVRPSHPNELLNRVPGVWVSRGSGQEHLTAIRTGVLTGAGACGEFLYLENGLPIRPHGFCNINNLFEVNLAQAEAVEVLRGPAGASLGGNALHGAINAISGLPADTGAKASLEAGPYGYGQGRISWDGASVRVDAVATDSDGYRDDTGYGEQKLSIAQSLQAFGFDVLNTLSATNLNQETGGFVLGENAYEDADLKDSNPNPEAYRDAFALRLASRWSRQLASEQTLNVTPYFRRSQMTFLQHFLPGQPTEANEQSSAGLMVTIEGGDDSLSYRVGTQLEWMAASLQQDQVGPTTGSAFLVETRPSGLHYDFDVDSQYLALFGRIDKQAGVASIWLSGRVEQLRYDYDNKTINGRTRDDGTTCGFGGCLYQRPADRNDDFTDVALDLGIRLPISERLEAYAAVASAFRPPQATELYRLQRDQSVADLDSESVRSAEVGFALSLADASLDVAIYDERSRNVIFRDASGFNVSDGRFRSTGIEIDGRWRFAEQQNLSLTASYGRHKYDFTRAAGGGEQIQSGNDVDTAPRWLASARWQLGIGEKAESEVEVVYQSKSYLDAANSQRYDGHTLLNWRASMRLADNVELFGRVLNLLDEDYAERADFAFGNFRYFPGMPRQFYAGVEVSW
ncbi:MAG: TonB-dependent receptor [Pseudomonadaceae bacterium]|nr:TonB-dependent receptor [Pseudomonadaceae bacterium]